MHSLLTTFVRSAALALAVLFPLAGCSPDPLDVAPNVDLERFQGQWFEIARLPRTAEANCTGTTAFYTLRDGGLDIQNQCHLDKLDGALRVQPMRAVKAESTSQLTISVHGFNGDYWILEVGDEYEYAVIGVPSRQYLWIMSRTPTLDKAVLAGILDRAKQKKFDTSHLEFTVQPTE